MKDINEEYALLEEQYLKGNRDILMNMFRFARKCLHSMVTKYNYKNDLGFSFEDIEERVDNGAYWFLERYLKNPEFKCGKLTSYLPFAFKKAMWGNDVKEKEYSQKCERTYIKEYKKQFHINNGGYEVNYEDPVRYIDVPCGTFSNHHRCYLSCLFSAQCCLHAEQETTGEVDGIGQTDRGTETEGTAETSGGETD